MNPSASVSELLAALAGYHQAAGQLPFYSEQCGNERVITFVVIDSALLNKQMAEMQATG